MTAEGEDLPPGLLNLLIGLLLGALTTLAILLWTCGLGRI